MRFSPLAKLGSVVRPILEGLLYALRHDVVAEVGGFENVKLKMLLRLYRPGDGDCGIRFEYSVHEAMRRGEGNVLDRVNSALSSPPNEPHDTPTALTSTGWPGW